MAFDSVFQGQPLGVAPGTSISPTLGVDVSNNTLWISAGFGWQLIGSGAIALNGISEQPTGNYPGTQYVLSEDPKFIFGVYLNGIFQPPTTYTILGDVITLGTTTTGGDQLYVVYVY